MRLLRPALATFVVLVLAATPASARTVRFDGRAVAVPSSWPVYRLAQRPRMCVRLDRRAVYLGTPGANQRCPADALGRRRAILVEPGRGERRARASGLAAPTPSPAVSGGSEQYTGLGFDACATPSARAMRAWASSPYRAIGIYIGGVNRACSQPNLTDEWVAEQVAAGWHLIPTYVGRQAPGSSCTSCAPLSSSTGRAAEQGTEAAEDAVAEAAAIGIAPGSPIYFDMEAYTRTTSATAATLTFLSAWTERLHAAGYVSGAYSSSSSGIADLGRAVGGRYALPDDVWTANWNGAENVLDPYLPSTAWASHDRIHQYRGGHNETYGLITINVDGDFVDGATVGSAIAGERPAPPPLSVGRVKAEGSTVRVWVRCGWPEGEECPGRIVLRTHARLPLRAPRGAKHVRPRLVRLSVGKHLFHLAGGRSHSFRVALDARGRTLFERRGFVRAQMLVAIPGARKTRALRLSWSR